MKRDDLREGAGQRSTREQLERRLETLQAALQRTTEQLSALALLAFTDLLTGLYNRRCFEDRLAQELSRSLRTPGGRFGLLALDVNGFKRVNDTLGHQAGDALLRAVGEHLKGSLRTHDVVCRTGGDEFMAILPDVGPVECAVAQSRLVRGLSRVQAVGIDQVGLAIGCSNFPLDGVRAETLIACADTRMYDHKRRLKRSPGLLVDVNPSSAQPEAT